MNIQPPKRSWKRFWLILAGILLVLAVIGALTGNPNTSTATTDQPTATVVPPTTQAPTVQPTQEPLTTEQQALQLAQHAAPNASKQTAKIDGSGNLIITEFQDIPSVTSVKVDCFNVLQALWKANLPGVHDIDLEITATLTDANGNSTVGSVGDCSLSHALNWNSLTWQSAWSAYDTQFVDPALSN